MKKQTIAIDIDDVLSAHAQAFLDFSNQEYGTKLTIEDYSDQWADMWHVDRDEIERRAKEFHVPEKVVEYALIKQADAIIKKLALKYNLVIVTARTKEMQKPTFDWLERYFPGVFRSVHFVPIWVPDNKVTKADICQQIGAEYLIDDVPEHCNIAAKTGIKALLFGDYAWNRNDLIEDRIVRVKDWPAVMEYFDGQK